MISKVIFCGFITKIVITKLFQAHGIGKPLEEITPRGPNLKLRKRYRQMIENELEFDRLADGDQSFAKGEVDEVSADLFTRMK